MATYSMTLREEKGSKLTAAELDGNFLYTMDAMNQMEEQIMASMSYVYNIVLNFGPTVVKKTITSTELKNSYNSPIELCPAQEGYVYTNFSAWMTLVNGTTSYESSIVNITFDNWEGTSHLVSNKLDVTDGNWYQFTSNMNDELPVFPNTSLILKTQTDISSEPGDYDIELILSLQVIQTFPY